MGLRLLRLLRLGLLRRRRLGLRLLCRLCRLLRLLRRRRLGLTQSNESGLKHQTTHTIERAQTLRAMGRAHDETCMQCDTRHQACRTARFWGTEGEGNRRGDLLERPRVKTGSEEAVPMHCERRLAKPP